jgi:hypothetical protein
MVRNSSHKLIPEIYHPRLSTTHGRKSTRLSLGTTITPQLLGEIAYGILERDAESVYWLRETSYLEIYSIGQQSALDVESKIPQTLLALEVPYP